MADKKPILNPENLLASGVTRPGPDVSVGQIMGAGATQEAIETDYWNLSEREYRSYLDPAMDRAAIAHGYAPEPEGEIGNLGAGDSGLYEQIGGPYDDKKDKILQWILEAQEKRPDLFEGVAITNDQILARVNADLKAEHDDAQKTLNLAPDTFMGRTVPEFVGRMGAAATDEINLPIAVMSLGMGESVNLGRLMLTEGALSVFGEATTLPKQFEMAERLDLPDPNVATQLAFAGAVGAGIPAAFRGAGATIRAGNKVATVTNREIVQRLRKQATKLSPEQTGALNKVESDVAEETVGPSSAGRDQVRAIDEATEGLNAGTGMVPNPPPVDGQKVKQLITPKTTKAPSHQSTQQAAKVKLSLESSLGALTRDSEARGSYDTPSDFTVVASPKPLTEMTLDEIDAWQRANQKAGAESTAAGGYQIIRKTLKSVRADLGLTGKEKFTPALQDRLQTALLNRRGLAEFKAGTLSANQFADNLAHEWAAFPLANGRSAYAGDGLNAAQVGRQTILDVLGGKAYQSSGRPPPRMSRVASAGVVANPKVYQFRSNVDGSGVGNPLNRVSEWDELLAGDFIIHEQFDGARFVADGHHRLQLANRLQSQGHAPIDFNAFVLREADGYSIEHVRAIAAVKNIEAGNASAIDAAKVLRIDPALLEKLTLRSTITRDARGLMKLSDDGFDMVTNDLLPEPYAAFVGDLTSDFEMQDALLRTLIQAKPRSQIEARQISQDALRAGLAQRDAGAQGSLFGDGFDLGQTLFKERASVLARALAQLRQDKRVFATLVRERDKIKEAGNALKTKDNAARVETDETALAVIEKLVNRAGPLDDALNNAASKAQRGGTEFGVRDFLGVVREAIEGGDVRRLLDGGTGGAKDAATPDGRAVDNAGSREGEIDPPPALLPDPAGAQVGLGNAFDDMSPDAPAIIAQADAAQNALRDAVAAGDDITLPTGREINGEAEVMSASDLLTELDDDLDFLEVLDACRN